MIGFVEYKLNAIVLVASVWGNIISSQVLTPDDVNSTIGGQKG